MPDKVCDICESSAQYYSFITVNGLFAYSPGDEFPNEQLSPLLEVQFHQLESIVDSGNPIWHELPVTVNCGSWNLDSVINGSNIYDIPFIDTASLEDH